MLASTHFRGGWMREIAKFIATGCYSGLMPIAPGTWGTAVGVLLFYFLRWLPTPVYVVTTLALIAVAIWASNEAQKIYEETDPPQVVIDEIAGYLVTMAFHHTDFSTAVAGFILFRIFDIIKPPPVRWFERRFSDGKGIVLDDVMAGVYANAALWLVELLMPNLGINW